MTTTSKRTSTGSRAPWSGLLDVLLGRVPARNAGFFQRPQEQSSDGSQETAAEASTATGTAEQSASVEETTSSPADDAEAVADSTSTSTDTSNDGADSTDQTDSTGLQVQQERVSLDKELGLGAVDGAWWPRSDTAADEVGELLGALPEDLGRVLRIALSMDDWSEEQPRVVHVGEHPLHLAWFDVMRRHTADLTFEDGRRVVLLVLPPSTEESAAREVLESVGQDRSREELLSRAGIELEQGSVDTSAQDEQPADSGSEGAV